MKFTIGIPAYKAKYLAECINSVLAQTYPDYEVIIVNDASPENLDAIISSYDSPKIRYYKNEKNFGALDVVDNWNKCLSLSKGSFFVLLGDDDKMSVDYLEEFSKLIDQYPHCDVYHCRTQIIDENSNPIRLTEPRPSWESVYDSLLERMKGSRVFFVSDYVYRTDTLLKNGGYYKLPMAWASDDITSYMAAAENGIAHTNKPVFLYRENSQTLSVTGNIFHKMDAILGEQRWIQAFIQRETSNVQDALLRSSIILESKRFIQKKKIRTIYSSGDTIVVSFFKWVKARKKYGLTMQEIVYAMLMTIKEKRKKVYDI